MENFCISYKVIRDDSDKKEYIDFTGLNPYPMDINYNYEEEVKHYMSQVNEIKEVILADFRRILEYRIKDLDNNFELTEQIINLLSTYMNGAEDTIYDTINYIILTDEYLCFNNIEIGYDEIYDHLNFDSEEAETIVITNRKFTKFIFLTKVRTVINEDTVTNIEVYEIKDNKIECSKTRINGDIVVERIDETTVDSVLESIKVLKR